jgi:DNA-binding beta-propeller fold protein YncE
MICVSFGMVRADSDKVILPGIQADGRVLLPDGWTLDPVGKQITLGDFPVNLALHPNGRHAAVLHSGWGKHEVRMIDIETGKTVSQADIPESYYGLEFGPDGSRLYASGAGEETVHVFSVASGSIKHLTAWQVRPASQKGVVAGLGVSADGAVLYSAGLFGHRVAATGTDTGETLWDIDLTSILPGKEAPFPIDCIVDSRRNRLYVSLWGRAEVVILDPGNGHLIGSWAAEDLPGEMLLRDKGRYLYVGNANRNSVTVFDTDRGIPIETLSAALFPEAPPGSTPNALALSPDNRLLFISNAGTNNVAVFDVTEPGYSKSVGFFPVGWRPNSVRVSLDGDQLLVANGMGTEPKANPGGPFPGDTRPKNLKEHIGGLFQGMLNMIPLPDDEEAFETLMVDYTRRAYASSPLQADNLPTGQDARTPNNPIPAKLGDPSPIRYVFFVVKENRTYDQILGDVEEGNGDPDLCLFPEVVTPNHHALAREFVLLDNFYVNGEVSRNGHEWTMGAYATDFIEKSWRLRYGGKGQGKVKWDSWGSTEPAIPYSGYLWDRAIEANVSFRSYGIFTVNNLQPTHATNNSLRGNVDPLYKSSDRRYPDVKRAARFISELKRIEESGKDLHQLNLIRLPNDHTAGTRPGLRTPRAFLGNNDLAVGRVVEAISHSRFWPQSAVFVIEDDAQNGPDHVDAHRSISLVASPYAKRGEVISDLYTTCSVLRTIELILGLEPMSQFDAAATPMYRCFNDVPNLAPYLAKPAQIDIDALNADDAYGAAESLEMNLLTTDDVADDIRLNEIVWKSVRGADSPMPSPVRAAFFLGLGGEDED